ncbi:hypothetical protein NUW58_g368 [Xylaria curta]|uniref:Uncharacterized protein n=1 Tax=Xylaria curta TaxID=42375 RepID=A0ACC1PS14_9PEZI|nr:hypothetical protein NUW58_g368 [Xylaria curta]
MRGYKLEARIEAQQWCDNGAFATISIDSAIQFLGDGNDKFISDAIYASAHLVAPGDDHVALRDHFEVIARRQLCIFCDLPLIPHGNSSWCDKGHVFENCANTGVPVVAPNVSRTCGVCGLKCLKSEELLSMAPQLKDIVEQDISSELCGGCGGKFTV